MLQLQSDKYDFYGLTELCHSHTSYHHCLKTVSTFFGVKYSFFLNFLNLPVTFIMKSHLPSETPTTPPCTSLVCSHIHDFTSLRATLFPSACLMFGITFVVPEVLFDTGVCWLTRLSYVHHPFFTSRKLTLVYDIVLQTKKQIQKNTETIPA